MSRSPQGYVDLVPFRGCLGEPTNPTGVVSHYLRSADDADTRKAEHRAGSGGRILTACVERAIAFELVATSAGAERSFERRMKRQDEAWRYCPRCRANRGVAGAETSGALADAKATPP